MSTIDWNLPIETDEETPRPARTDGATPFPGYWVIIGTGNSYGYYLTGEPANSIGWGVSPLLPRIRNVRTLRTSDECLQRMEALVRRMAAQNAPDSILATDHPDYAEAHKIVKMLPKPPVDPDLIEARKIVDAREPGDWTTSAVLAGIKRGRELAHAEHEAAALMGVEHSE